MKDIIVIPTYNERDNIGVLVQIIFQMFPNIFVVVADDNSPDGTAEIVRELSKTYPNLSLILKQKRDGYARAYTNAFREILKDHDVRSVITMDADLSHHPKYLSGMFEKFNPTTMVIGSRYIKGGGTIGWELWRRLLSRGGNLYCRYVTSLPIHDCTGGYNIIAADLLRKIDLSKISTSGYALFVEVKYLLRKTGTRFVEVPIVFTNRVEGKSKITGNIISEGVLVPWRIRFRK